MRLFYYRSIEGNFGDDLNALIWPRLLPDCLEVGGERYREDVQLIGIGTILGHRLPPAKLNIIMGSGVGYGPTPGRLDPTVFHTMAVRGPLSARVLRLPDECAVTDSAVLLHGLGPWGEPGVESSGMGDAVSRRDVVFMPHHSAAATGGWELACREAGVVYLDPRGNCEALIRAIAGARLVIADAMHGAIVADVLRVPWVPVVSSLEINTFKWLDWTLSMRVPYRPVELPLLTPIQVARRTYKTLLAQRHHQANASAATALDAHARDEALRPPAWLSAWRRSVLPVDRSTEPGGQRRSLLTEPWRRQLDKAIAVLQRLTEVPGVLSDERVLHARHTTYEDRLEALRRLLDNRR